MREGASLRWPGRLGLKPAAFSSFSISADSWLAGSAAVAAAAADVGKPRPGGAELPSAAPPEAVAKERLRPARGGNRDPGAPLLRDCCKLLSRPLLLMPEASTALAAAAAGVVSAAPAAAAAGDGCGCCEEGPCGESVAEIG